MKRSCVLPFPAHQLRAFEYDSQTGDITIRLHVGDDLAPNLVDVLNGLVALVGDLRRAAERAERAIATDARIEAHRRRCVELARAYQRLRLSGMKHRAAIRALFVDPAFSDLHFSTADIADTVKRYGGAR